MKQNMALSLLYIFAAYIALSFAILFILVWRFEKPLHAPHVLFLMTSLWIFVASCAGLPASIRVQRAMRRGERPIEEVDMRIRLQTALATAGTAIFTVDILVGCFSAGWPVEGLDRISDVLMVLVLWLQVPTWQSLARQARQPGLSHLQDGLGSRP